MKKYAIILVLVAVTFIPVNIAAKENNKGKLLNSIVQKQTKIEQQIVDLWLTGERGEKLELLLSEYITLEVRYRAISGNPTNNSLINKVSQNKSDKDSNHLELAKKIVLEFFNRKGIDLEDRNFVDGEYLILTSQ
jgi:hypothetical protein